MSLRSFVKHLEGQHDQSSHSGNGSGSGRNGSGNGGGGGDLGAVGEAGAQAFNDYDDAKTRGNILTLRDSLDAGIEASSDAMRLEGVNKEAVARARDELKRAREVSGQETMTREHHKRVFREVVALGDAGFKILSDEVNRLMNLPGNKR